MRLRNNLLGFFAGAFALLCAFMLMAPSGGFPSRPRFQTVLVGIGAAPTQRGDFTARNDVNGGVSAIVDNDSNDTANQARVIVSSGDAQLQVQSGGSGRISPLITNGTTGAVGVVKTFGAIPLEFATSNTLAATISGAQVANFVNTPTIAGTAIYESGTFIASFVTACTTTPTMTFDYQRVGNIVSLSAVADTGFPCVSDSTSFLAANAVPASIRPLAGGGSGVSGAPEAGFLNNSVDTSAKLSIEVDGDLVFARCATFGAACSNVGWTASNNKDTPILFQFTYMLGNP